jgi:single-stranded-DNA-specific exonuclease
LATLLSFRGIKTLSEAESFLNPDFENHLHDPFLMKDMEKAAERVLQALCNNERIAVWSDYDADGIPGAVVWHDFFKKIGFENFENYIPDRHEEGFGLNHDGVETLAGRGVKLLITVDCGIADAKEVMHARSLGIDVIITDHHLLNGQSPDAVAVIDPNQPGCTYPNKDLCGAGVAFQLVRAVLALARRQSNFRLSWRLPIEGWEKWLLDMVGLATLSDMVSLKGENRALAYYGLRVLRKSPRAGWRALFSLLKLNQKQLTEDDIGFMITPRINAASRLGQPFEAFKLLVTADDLEASLLAKRLNRINDERKGRVAALVREIRKIIAERALLAERKLIVVGNPNWRPALLGLVANSLATTYQRPVFLWGREGGNSFKGSCRSDGSVNLVSLMAAARDNFLDFGGHHSSGGFTVNPEKIHSLADDLERAFEGTRSIFIDGPENKSGCSFEAVLSLDEVNEENFSLIEKLAPFGVGNPKPVFLFENALVVSVRQFGKESNHLSLTLRARSGKKISAVAFFASPDAFFSGQIKSGGRINLVATIEKSYFRSAPELRLRLVNLR